MMNRKMLRNFLVDRLLLIGIYFLNTFFIILFYTLVVSKSEEVLYPISISIFLFCILISIDYFRYYKFNHRVNRVFEDNNYSLEPMTLEQKELGKALKYVNESYTEEINKVKSNYERKIHFLSQWIHKFKTPISVINLIIDKYKREEALTIEVLNSIEVENNSLNCSVEQVLNYIRIENFEKDFEASSMDLILSLRQVINENRNQFIYNNIFPLINSSYEEAYVVSDKKWNRVILEQIITNAIKYSFEENSNKNIYFTISKDDKYTYLSIKDEGRGIPVYDLDRVFEAFFTGENGRNVRNSTGIGLYITKEIAKKLGHQLEIKSEVNEGTEVIIKYLSKL